ncbi:MAG TPA: efflux RND transporter permease subunit, partial [Candidatus Acidoferrum sp.]
AVAIPTSIIATFTLMRAMDFSLNNMTLLALTLAVGIVIDDAIIVLENIFRFMEEKGKDRATAAVQATREIGLAVMATTLSLVIIFLPIAFMSGYARKYVNSFGWTMAMAIMVSLLVAFTLTPMMSSRLLKVGAKEKEQHAHGFMHSIEEFYLKLLRWSLAHRRIILVIYVVTFASTFGLYHLVGRDWIPADDQAELMSSFTLPEGTSLEKTTQMAQDMAGRVVALPEVAFVQTLTHGPTNHAHLFIGLVPRTERKRTHEQMAGVVRGILGSYRNITYNVRLPSVLGGETYFPIAAVIRGPEIDRLAEISKKIANRMRQFPELVDVNPSLNLNTPELQVKLDRQRAADIGVRMMDVSDSVRLFYSGEDEITRFKEGSEQYPVVMQLLPEQRDNPEVLASMMVPSTKLGQVRLENVASIVRGAGPATLWRYNREFQV